jgi:hypothetical protein
MSLVREESFFVQQWSLSDPALLTVGSLSSERHIIQGYMDIDPRNSATLCIARCVTCDHESQVADRRGNQLRR